MKAPAKPKRRPYGLRRQAKRDAAFRGDAVPKAPSPLRFRGAPKRASATAAAGTLHNLETELLILPDGRILVHNLTQPFAELLRELNPDDQQIASRTTHHAPRTTFP